MHGNVDQEETESRQIVVDIEDCRFDMLPLDLLVWVLELVSSHARITPQTHSQLCVRELGVHSR